jgi:predicted small metal-binding protein
MREINCPACGQHAEAENDEALFKIARAHANQAHSDQNLTDDQVREIIRQNAKNKS